MPQQEMFFYVRENNKAYNAKIQAQRCFLYQANEFIMYTFFYSSMLKKSYLNNVFNVNVHFRRKKVVQKFQNSNYFDEIMTLNNQDVFSNLHFQFLLLSVLSSSFNLVKLQISKIQVSTGQNQQNNDIDSIRICADKPNGFQVPLPQPLGHNILILSLKTKLEHYFNIIFNKVSKKQTFQQCKKDEQHLQNKIIQIAFESHVQHTLFAFFSKFQKANLHNMMQQLVKMLNKNRRFFDIAANLTDQQFGNNKHHEDDRLNVVKRALQVGCSHLLIAAGCLQDATHSYQLCKKIQHSYCTIGVHPCRAAQPLNKQKHASLQEYIAKVQAQAFRIKDKLVAIGQCGLDYDRFNYASKEQQLQVFPFHFDLAQKLKLPMYLHNRNTGSDFYDIVRKNRDRFTTGVVHSFTGNIQQLKQIVELDLYIGINGCSFKTQQNLETLKAIPLDRIMLETDAPYCQIRNSHAGAKFVKTKFASKNKRTEGFVLKGRNEPCKIVEVLEVASSVLGISEEELSEIAFANSLKIFNCN